MDIVDPIRFVFASFLVLGLLGMLAITLKYYGKKSLNFLGAKLITANQKTGRIFIVEVQYVDHKLKLVLVKRDDVEHLLLVGDGRTTIIESGIKHNV